MRRYVIKRESDGRYWCSNLQGGPWSIDISNARPLSRGDALFYRGNPIRHIVVPVEVAISEVKKAKGGR